MTASLSSAQAPICIDSMAIPGHQNEMSAFAKFLQALVGADGALRLFRVVTADAGSRRRRMRASSTATASTPS